MDYAPNQTLDFKFALTSTAHMPEQIVGGAVVVYKDNETTEITAGITYTADFDGKNGLNNVRIEATTANGYASGSSYYLVMSAGTIGGNSIVGSVVGEFTIGRGAASIAEPVETTRQSDTVTTGTQTGTSANTLVEDGTYWQLTSVAAGIDAELVFNIGANGNENPSAVRLWGRFQSQKNHVLQLQAWNYAHAAWENLGAALANVSSDYEIIRSLGRALVRRGTGPGVDGDVRIRFNYTTATSNKVSAGQDFFVDKASVFYTLESITTGELLKIILDGNPQRNYPDSAIVVDFENGQPGRTYGVHGTPGNPTSTLADAFALAEIAGFARYLIRGDTVLTLDVAYADWEFQLSPNAVIDLNGQDVDGSSFVGGTVRGVGLAATNGIKVANAILDGVTSQGIFNACALPKADSLIANGPNVFLLDCESIFPGTANPSVSGGNVANLQLSIVKYAGGIDVSGLADSANVTVSGRGSVNLTDANSAATVIISGHMRRGGSLPAGLTLISDARIDTGQITASAWADATAPNGTAMSRAVDAIGLGTVAAGATDSFLPTSSLDPPAAVANQFIGRVLTFPKTTTTPALRNQASVIAAVDASGGITLQDPLTQAPPAGEVFTIQ